MNYQGTQLLDQPMQRVWDALLDPAVLRQCIAGCETFERTSDSGFASTVKVSIGPVAARFTSTMTLADVEAPHRCTLRFSGQGGVAGFGKGEAHVELVETAPGQTRLDWTADAQVGGKIAQLGSRLIEGTVRRMSEDFFQRFAAQLSTLAPVAPPEETAALPARACVRWSWVAALLAVMGLLAVWWRLVP
ncbi:SRPBCC family protein [Hydrogenophaga sp. BPS33]|uniref:SRPBCC family protein n=1 Tax=Hydrogenophaga sp. BPS33 TaxID=2651974 RepID=UPI0013201C18|nr:carbon monoxide dehydrogenase subunit G [Hydrogenophaga sp. BPS33]QHE87391.1 carbon monoxide dehydrogenase subunit G [Hydrogenophaga sp. BPS33]